MGAWGFGSFENDTALDWVGDFSDAPSLEELNHGLNAVLDPEAASESQSSLMEDLDDEVACPIAIAAAEVVAAMRGHPNPDFPEDLQNWVSANRSGADAKLADKALAAARSALANDDFRSCFFDDDGVKQWESSVNELIGRLTRPPQS